jgi:hypothetical protein
MFLERLYRSHAAVFAFGQHLHHYGYTIEIRRTRYAPTAKQAPEYSDSGDLFAIDEDEQAVFRCEVKGLSCSFTSDDDWPFREVFVSSATSVERHGTSVDFYVSVNAQLTHCAIISQDTRAFWYPTQNFNHVTGNLEDYIACPTHLVRFKLLKLYNVKVPA